MRRFPFPARPRSGWLGTLRGRAAPRAGRADSPSVAVAAGIVGRRSFTRAARTPFRPRGSEPEVDVAPHGLSVEEVVWEVRGGQSAFIFHPAVFDHPHAIPLIERWIDTLPLLTSALARCGSVSGRTSIALGDCGTGRGLSFCDHRPDALLLPDPVFVRENGYEAQKRAFAEQDVPWLDRQPRALWRGQTSGWHDASGRPVATWRDLPRVRLCRLARQQDHHDLIDAGLTGVVQIADPTAVESIRNDGMMAPRLAWQRFSDWRYQIDIDGNTSAWEGLFVKLCTGSAVLKVRSGFGFRQWYYRHLEPWKHFVPVEADLDDLADKVRWLRQHEHRAEAMGRAGRAFADSIDVPSQTALAAGTIREALSDPLATNASSS